MMHTEPTLKQFARGLSKAVGAAAIALLAPMAGHLPATAQDMELRARLEAYAVVVEVNGSQGSGVILTDGRIITNCHVVEDGWLDGVAPGVRAKAGAPLLRAELVGRDGQHDLCMLALHNPNGLAAEARATIANGVTEPGAIVFAVGAPDGYSDRITKGTVKKYRQFSELPLRIRKEVRDDYQLCRAADQAGTWYIETDAAITFGSSGGGLFNQAGELAGITTYIQEGREISYRFAIPAARVRALLEQDPDNALQELVEYLAENGKLEFARQTAERIEKPRKQVAALEAIAKAELAAGRKRPAIRTLMAAVTIAAEITKQTTRRNNLARLSTKLTNAGAFAEAFHVIAHIEDPKTQWNELKHVARRQAQAGGFSSAYRTVEMISDRPTRIMAGDFVRGEQFRALLDADNVSTALQISERIVNVESRISALRRAAGAQGRAGDVTGSRQTYARAIRLATGVIDLNARSANLIEIAADLADEDYPTNPRTTVESAIRAADAIRTDSTRDESFHTIVVVLDDMEGFTATQLEVAGHIRDPDVRDSARAVIVKTFAERQQFSEASKTVYTIQDSATRGQATKDLIDELLDSGNRREAWELARRIFDPAARAQAEDAVARAYADDENFDRAVAIAEYIRDHVVKTRLYAAVAEGILYADWPNRASARELVATAEGLAYDIPDEDTRIDVLIEVAVLHIELDQNLRADRIALALADDHRDHDRILGALSRASARQDKFDQARAYIREMSECPPTRYRDNAIEDLEERLERARN